MANGMQNKSDLRKFYGNIKSHVISQLQAGHCDQYFKNGILGLEVRIMGRTTFKQPAMDKENDDLIN